jgi:16S rRNA (cytosine1402-N4)-methyltransferase
VAEEHVPVLLDEALAALAVRPGGRYVDATFGRGGHSAQIVAKLAEHGALVALDRDPVAVRAGRERFAGDARVTVEHAAFAELEAVLKAHGWWGSVDGILLDIGVSSPQIDTPDRGFSFASDGPLDMRMDPTSGISAQEWLAAADERDMSRVIKQFGEERFARRIAGAIVRARRESPLTTTGQLAEVVSAAVPPSRARIHPATRTFQAIRIYINDELGQLKRVLPLCVDALRVGGHCAVICFHSLEDRIVKRFFRDGTKVDPVFAGFPVIPDEAQPRLEWVTRRARAQDAEIERNVRARSATLRAVRRLR